MQALDVFLISNTSDNLASDRVRDFNIPGNFDNLAMTVMSISPAGNATLPRRFHVSHAVRSPNVMSLASRFLCR